MSRSRRHTPIIGHTSSESEKYDKQSASRRERKWVADHLKERDATAEDFQSSLTREHPRSGGWTFAKDGKSYIGSRFPKLLRK